MAEQLLLYRHLKNEVSFLIRHILLAIKIRQGNAPTVI